MTPEVLSPVSPTQSVPGPVPRSRDIIKRRVKSPEVHETTFTMSTIEEEIESVNTNYS